MTEIIPIYFTEFLDEMKVTPDKQKSFIEMYKTLSISERSRLIYETIGKKVYREYPVDILTFIHDPEYLGMLYGDTVFPLWEETLLDIYPAPLCKNYNEGILSVATRAGKSCCIAISALYEIYLLSCMINPASVLYGGTKSSAEIVFALLSLDTQTACSQLGEKVLKGLTTSPALSDYILPKLSFSSIDKEGMKISKDIIIKAGSSENTVTGTDLYFGALDEANMPSPIIAANKLVETRIGMYRSMIDRRSATFERAPKKPGMIWLTSSPRDEGDVIEERITELKETGMLETAKILDNIPRWEARNMQYKDTFKFFLGSDTKDPCALELTNLKEEDLPSDKIIEVPRNPDFWSKFTGPDVRRAIQEIAGRRTTAECSLFNSVSIFTEVFSKENTIFSKDDLSINVDNLHNIEDYLIDKDYFKHPNKPECYRYIHLDIASKTDRFGLTSVYSDKIKYTSDTGEEVFRRKYYIDFCLGISANKGKAVDILKVIQYVCNLKKNYQYPIKIITTDSHQGELARQIIQKRGVDAEYLSVEKTPMPYYNLKNIIVSKSLEGFINPLLTRELKGLRINKKGMKERIEKGKGYTDDLSDSLAGALFTCMNDSNFKLTNMMVEEILAKLNSDGTNNINIYLNNINNLNTYTTGVTTQVEDISGHFNS